MPLAPALRGGGKTLKQLDNRNRVNQLKFGSINIINSWSEMSDISIDRLSELKLKRQHRILPQELNYSLLCRLREHKETNIIIPLPVYNDVLWSHSVDV